VPGVRIECAVLGRRFDSRRSPRVFMVLMLFHPARPPFFRPRSLHARL